MCPMWPQSPNQREGVTNGLLADLRDSNGAESTNRFTSRRLQQRSHVSLCVCNTTEKLSQESTENRNVWGWMQTFWLMNERGGPAHCSAFCSIPVKLRRRPQMETHTAPSLPHLLTLSLTITHSLTSHTLRRQTSVTSIWATGQQLTPEAEAAGAGKVHTHTHMHILPTHSYTHTYVHTDTYANR